MHACITLFLGLSIFFVGLPDHFHSVGDENKRRLKTKTPYCIVLVVSFRFMSYTRCCHRAKRALSTFFYMTAIRLTVAQQR